MLAAVVVVAALGAYAVARHDGSPVTLQTSAGSPCPGQVSANGHCRVAPTGTGAGSAAAGASGRAGPGTSAPSASPRRSRAASSSPPAARSTAPASASPSAAPPAPAPSASAPAGTPSAEATAEVLAVINQARGQAGLPPYTMSAGLDTSAERHTTLMASGCGLQHQCPGEADLGTRISDAGVQWSAVGENIGEGGPEPDTGAAISQMAVSLTQSMLAERPPDDGHRLNILSSTYRFVGIYVFRDSSGTVWMTQDFSN